MRPHSVYFVISLALNDLNSALSAKAIQIWIYELLRNGLSIQKRNMYKTKLFVHQKTSLLSEPLLVTRARRSARNNTLSLNLSGRSLRRILDSDLNFQQFNNDIDHLDRNLDILIN